MKYLLLFIAIAIIVFSCCFMFDAASKELISKEEGHPQGLSSNFKEQNLINPNQPISVDEEIYSIMQEVLNPQSFDYSKVRVWEIEKYIYKGFENGSLRVLYQKVHEEESVYTFSAYEPEINEAKTIKEQIFWLPVNQYRQGILIAINGEKIVLTLVDESERITAQELGEQ